MAWLVIRVRGTLHARGDITDTLRFLHLTRPNHATVVAERPDVRGMLHKVQGYITWGEVDTPTLELLLRQRGVATDGRSLGAPAATGASAPALGPLAQRALSEGLDHVPEVRPLFRLKAPTGGWRSTKKPFRLGGALGYRGAAVNDLARKMV